MQAVEVPFGAVMLDMLSPLSAEVLDALEGFVLPGTKTGITLFGRYLENLTPDELDRILSRGYGLIFIGESRPNGYVPSATSGGADGLREVARMRDLGLPEGVTEVCDLEGMSGTDQDTIAYANAYGSCIQAARYSCMTYVGDSVPLSPAQLYSLAHTTLYWHSLSNVQQVATCDYCAIQAYPTQKLVLPGGITLAADVSFIYRDKRGRAPKMAVSDEYIRHT
jgi:hypothetical protein